MELDEIRGGFSRRLGGEGLCFCVEGFWIQDVDEKVAVFYADHGLCVIVVKSLPYLTLCGRGTGLYWEFGTTQPYRLYVR